MMKAVLLDYDGVVVNSMPYHIQAWQRIFSEYDIKIEPEEILLTEGSRSIEVARKICRERGRELSEKELQTIVHKKQKYYREITRAEIQPGVIDFIQKVKQQDFKIGLVTGSARANVQKVLSFNFLNNFDIVITGDEIKRGKPDPEAYLKAANHLHLKPQECLVVENAPLGIQAARNAGMYVIALTTTLDPHHLNGAHIIFKDMKELVNRWDTLIKEIQGYEVR